MQKLITEIHLFNLRANALAFRKATGSALCAVVKADAYGHGAIEVVNALYSVADFFAVAIVEEGLSILPAAGGKGILVFTPPICEAEAVVALRSGLWLSVTDLPTAKLIAAVCERYALSACVHLKVNTGMNRYGVSVEELDGLCRFLAGQRRVSVKGIFSHLYTTDEKISRAQREEFLRGIDIAKRYFSPLTAHLSATYGATLGREFAFDATRIGLGLYGYTPVPCPTLSLRPVMRAYATCTGNRLYQSGGIGYGLPANLSAKEGQNIALLRAGYADGTGLLGAHYEGLPLYNRFCMDVGFTSERVEKGEKVALFSSAEELALAQGTIVYETLCRLGMRAQRLYVQ